MSDAKGGRPAGLLLNHEAARHLLGDRSQRWLAEQAQMTEGNVSAMLAGTKGVENATAMRIAAALECAPGVIFPELVGFSCQVRVFTHTGIDQ
jgi:DNA-binding Xre family transcriptional regulator